VDLGAEGIQLRWPRRALVARRARAPKRAPHRVAVVAGAPRDLADRQPLDLPHAPDLRPPQHIQHFPSPRLDPVESSEGQDHAGRDPHPQGGCDFDRPSWVIIRPASAGESTVHGQCRFRTPDRRAGGSTHPTAGRPAPCEDRFRTHGPARQRGSAGASSGVHFGPLDRGPRRDRSPHRRRRFRTPDPPPGGIDHPVADIDPDAPTYPPAGSITSSASISDHPPQLPGGVDQVGIIAASGRAQRPRNRCARVVTQTPFI
jgi:hypothetical protein